MQTLQFSEVTEAVHSLNYEDKVELQELLSHYLIEEERENIFKNYQEGKKELESGNINYYKSTKELRKALEND